MFSDDNKNHTDFQYNSGDLVYTISPLPCQLRTIQERLLKNI